MKRIISCVLMSLCSSAHAGFLCERFDEWSDEILEKGRKVFNDDSELFDVAPSTSASETVTLKRSHSQRSLKLKYIVRNYECQGCAETWRGSGVTLEFHINEAVSDRHSGKVKATLWRNAFGYPAIKIEDLLCSGVTW